MPKIQILVTCFFKLNYEYHLFVFYKKNFDFYSKLKTIKKLIFKL